MRNTVENIEQYLAAVHSVNSKWQLDDATTHAWYRGQSSAKWNLLPSIYRGGGDNTLERELLRDFKLYSSRFLNLEPKNDLEWLFIMQHYGISTRLLDWSENHLTALYFAVLDYKNTCDAAVWVLDGWSLNERTLEIYSIPTSDNSLLENYSIKQLNDGLNRTIEEELPIAIRPSRLTPRIVAQKGMFTIHGKDKRSLDEIIDDINDIGNSAMYTSGLLSKINLEKIIICGSCKKRILQNLMQAGISHSVLFPELEGLAKEINFRYSRDYVDMEGHAHSGF